MKESLLRWRHALSVCLLVGLASCSNQSCRAGRSVGDLGVDAADTRVHKDQSTQEDGRQNHGHASRYHLESRPIAVVEFPEPIGKTSSIVDANISEARDPNRRWDDNAYWAWSFIPVRKPKSKYEALDIRLPVKPYEDMEKRYKVNKETVYNGSVDIGYTNGKEGDENRWYSVERDPNFQSYIEIKDIEGTKITLKVHVNLWNVDNWKNEETRDVIEIRETFTSPWYVDCSYLDGSGGWAVDNKKESEFCSQFKEAPWPHVHQ